LAAETGIPAFMFISFFFLAIMKIILSLWHKRNSAFSVFATLGCLIGIVSIILHSFFDFVFHIPANAYLFFMLLPLALRSVYLKKEQSLLPVPRIGINFSGVFIPCAILLSLFLLCFIEVSISRRYLAKAIYQEVAESKPPGSGLDDLLRYAKLIKKIEHAASLNPLSAKYISKKGDILLEVANRRDFEPQLQYFGELQNRMAILGEAETCYRKAIDIDPAKADYHLQLGWIYSLLGKTELMHSQFKKAILLDKKNTKLKSYVEDYTKALGFLENKIF
jgi:tetratricopeptide (TPR) repeat protein